MYGKKVRLPGPQPDIVGAGHLDLREAILPTALAQYLEAIEPLADLEDPFVHGAKEDSPTDVCGTAHDR